MRHAPAKTVAFIFFNSGKNKLWEPLKTQDSPHITPASDTLQQIFCVFFIVFRGSLMKRIIKGILFR
jgi:hypothetical protein